MMLRFDNQMKKYFLLPLNGFVPFVNLIFLYFLCYKNNILGNTECSQYNILDEADRGISYGSGSGRCDQTNSNNKSLMWRGASWYRYMIISNLNMNIKQELNAMNAPPPPPPVFFYLIFCV